MRVVLLALIAATGCTSPDNAEGDSPDGSAEARAIQQQDEAHKACRWYIDAEEAIATAWGVDSEFANTDGGAFLLGLSPCTLTPTDNARIARLRGVGDAAPPVFGFAALCEQCRKAATACMKYAEGHPDASGMCFGAAP